MNQPLRVLLLQESEIEAKYQGLFENAVIGIFQTTQDGHYINANVALAKIYGYESTADMMAHITNIEQQLYVNPKRRQEFTSLMQQYDAVLEFKSQIYRKDGSIIWILENAWAVRDNSGRLLYYEGFVKDVTERHLAATALHDAKQDLELRVEERTRQLREANAQLQREVNDRKKAEAMLAGHNQVLELMLRGTPLPQVLSAIARIIEDLAAPIKCHFLLLTPNDSQLRLGAAPSLPTVFNQALDGMAVAPGALSCGTAAYRREPVIVPDIATDALWKNYRDLALSVGLQACYSVPIITISGEVLGTFTMFYFQPHTPSDAEKQLAWEATHWASIAIERDRTHHQLQSTQMQLVQTEKMSSLGQLVAGIGHEINNPVSCIYNNLKFLSEYTQEILTLLNLYQQHYPEPALLIQAHMETINWEFVRQDLPRMLSSMKLGTDRICDIVLSLRNFSRVDQTTAQTVDIHQIIDNVVLILQHRLKPSGSKPGIAIIKDYGELPPVKCYPGQLNQVFMNLIANAIDALEEGHDSGVIGNSEENCNYQLPTIHIHTQFLAANSRVLIHITDNGSGIPSEYQHQIFNTFFTTKPVGKGTGLGLSISYKIIVEKHNGKLECFSEPGKGTEFLIEIPLLVE